MMAFIHLGIELMAFSMISSSNSSQHISILRFNPAKLEGGLVLTTCFLWGSRRAIVQPSHSSTQVYWYPIIPSFFALCALDHYLVEVSIQQDGL